MLGLILAPLGRMIMLGLLHNVTYHGDYFGTYVAPLGRMIILGLLYGATWQDDYVGTVMQCHLSG